MIKRMIALTMLIALSLSAVAAEPAPTLSKAQHDRLELPQLRLKLAYVALQNVQNEFQAKLGEFNAVCAEVVKELKAPEGTRCSPDTLEIIVPPAPVKDSTSKPEGKK